MNNGINESELYEHHCDRCKKEVSQPVFLHIETKTEKKQYCTQCIVDVIESVPIK